MGREFNPDYTYVINDLRRIGILAGSFFVVLVVLSFFLRWSRLIVGYIWTTPTNSKLEYEHQVDRGIDDRSYRRGHGHLLS